MTPDYMTANELAKHISITPRTLHKWAKEGRIPPGKKIGRIRLWSWNEVNLHLSSDRTNMVSTETNVFEEIKNDTLALRRAFSRRARG